MDRTVHRIVPTIVTITPVMLCLVYVHMVVEKVGWAAWTHQAYAVCNMDPSNMLLTKWTDQA
jgi:hypothetical protein